jgi:hypothetical protein
MHCLIIAIVLLVATLGRGSELIAGNAATVRLPVMTWFHPVLTPGVSDILLVCSVAAVTPAEKVYQNDYWAVTLRIEERIFVAGRYQKRLENVRFIETGDFRRREVGERLILFAGGEPYEGDDFLLPCWSGTTSDLGIVLHPKDHDDAEKDAELLKQLRSAVAGSGDELELFDAFAEFCPKGVARLLISRLRKQELELEASCPTTATKK